MPSVNQGGIKYHFFESLVWLDQGLNPGLPGHWQTQWLSSLEIEAANRVRILNQAACILHSANILGEMYESIFSSAMGK